MNDDHNKMNAEFYRDKAWTFLMEEIKAIKEQQGKMSDDIETIKNKMAWVFGIAAGVTFIFNIAWQWMLAKIPK